MRMSSLIVLNENDVQPPLDSAMCSSRASIVPLRLASTATKSANAAGFTGTKLLGHVGVARAAEVCVAELQRRARAATVASSGGVRGAARRKTHPGA